MADCRTTAVRLFVADEIVMWIYSLVSVCGLYKTMRKSQHRILLSIEMDFMSN